MKAAALKSRGQIFIVALIIIIVVVALLIVAMRSLRARESPIVKEASWLVDDEVVSVAASGEEIQARITIEAREEYVGSILVKIRKDVAWWLDTDYQFSTFPVNLRGGDETELALSFVPDQASRGRLRGYFIEVNFQVTGSNWVMEDSYPPRLKIVD